MRYKNTLIKNIFYMLSYAFQELQRKNYESVGYEDFEYIEDLMAEILYRGVSIQLKQGFHKEYISIQDDIPTVKGRIDMAGTMRLRMANKINICCKYDELSENIPLNQIIKSTLIYLMFCSKVDPVRRAKIKSILPIFGQVEILNLKQLRWDTLKFDRSLGLYKMLINICYLVVNGMIQSSDEGAHRLAAFLDENIERLFEKFVLNYYQKEHKDLNAGNPKVDWDIIGDINENKNFLPTMQSDIVLKKNGNALIIDTKFYTSTTQHHYDTNKIHSGNLYQIFTYVKNYNKGYNVSGMLLYAKTEDEEEPLLDVNIGGNRIMVKTLDLNQDFKNIREQLDKIATEI